MSQRKETIFTSASFEEQANTLLEDVLSRPDGENLFAMTVILYKLREAARDFSLQERLLLARKTLNCCQESTVPLLIAERTDAVASLLENGIQAIRSPEFPEITPDQAKQLLLTCNIEVFTDIVDAVAVDNQHFYAPDNQYFGMDTVREQAIEAIQSVIDNTVEVSVPQNESLPKKEIPPIFKEMSEDIINDLENILRDGFYPTFVDVCAELPFPDEFYPGHTLVIWGEENDKSERFYSISVCESFAGTVDESVIAMFTESDSFDDLQLGIETVLSRFDEKMKSNLFVFDEELLVNDDMESVNAYLWALDGLVDRLPSSEEMENINFYANYNVKTGDIIVVATYDTVAADGELNKETEVSISCKEKSQLITSLQRFCAERYAVGSCLEFVNVARMEERLGEISASSAKSSLTDVIRSASAKATNAALENGQPDKEPTTER